MLNEFINNPFFAYYQSELQSLADIATASICRGFIGERDLCAILEREQTIGAAPTYLKFGQLVSSDLTELQDEIKKNQ